MKNFNLDKSIALLERAPATYKALLYDMEENWYGINEGPDTWSGFDILGHLIHGEKTDWIPRASLILSDDDDKTFEPFDRFAQRHIIPGKTINELLDHFEEMRTINLEILRGWKLTEDQLELTGNHPELGTVTLRQHLSVWTIHDMMHLNQLSRVMVKHYAEDIGSWKAYSNLLKDL